MDEFLQFAAAVFVLALAAFIAVGTYQFATYTPDKCQCEAKCCEATK